MSFRFYHIINALSIDVALGAGVLSLVLGRYLGFRVPALTLLTLVFTVWAIYAADHLLDARSIKGQASSFRHHFHQHFYRPLLIALILVLILLVFLVTQIPPITVFYGIPILFGVLVYFVLNRFFRMSFQKEILISALYVLGVFIGPFSLSVNPLTDDMYLLLLQLGIMAWTNLLIFGIFEINEDKQDGFKSTVIVLGVDRAGQLIKFLIILTFAVGVLGLIFFAAHTNYLKLQIVFLFMNGVLGTLYFRRETLTRQGLHYRYFGDGIFFMPVAFFWF